MPEVTTVDKWALANLILAIAGVVLAVLVTIQTLLFKKKNEKENNTKQGTTYEHKETFAKRSLPWLILTILVGIVSVLLFVFTQDTRLPMGIVDKWTIAHIILFIIGIITTYLYIKTIKQKTTQQQQQQQTPPLSMHKT
jgi:uncharacterized membrane protein